MDDTVVGFDIGWVSGSSEFLLSDDGIVHESLTELALVFEGLSVEGVDIGTDGSGGDLSLGNVVFDDGRGHFSSEGAHGGVSRQKEGEWTCSGKLGCHASSVDGGDELSESVELLEVTLFLSDGDTFGTPDDWNSLKVGGGVDDVGVQRSWGSGAWGDSEGGARGGGKSEDGDTREHCKRV